MPKIETDALAWWREHEHTIVVGVMIFSGVALLGLVAVSIKAIHVGAPLAAKVLAAKYLPLAAI